MSANALVQTRIDPDIKERATAVLEGVGLSVSDAVRIMLTRTANEGVLPFDLSSSSEAYDLWFRLKVQTALDDLDSGKNRVIPDAEWREISNRKRDALKRMISDRSE